jgi:L-amino acid N-acyltransferase YncA
VVVRDVRDEDAAGIVAVLNPIIAARCYTALDTPIGVEDERRFIRTFPERGVFHVAVDSTGGAIVGLQDVAPFADFTHAFDHVGVIGTYVALARHRQGIAAALFAATYAAARRKGYEKLFAYVRADNEAGLRAYLGQGFHVIGTAARHARIDGRYIDEILIERHLHSDQSVGH